MFHATASFRTCPNQGVFRYDHSGALNRAGSPISQPIGPVLVPMVQADGIARVGEIAVGVGVDIGEQDPQGGAVHFLFEVPLLAVGPRVQGPLLVGTQTCKTCQELSRPKSIKS